MFKPALVMVEDIQFVPKAKVTFTIFSDCYTAIGLCTQHQKLISTTLHYHALQRPTSERNAELGANAFQQSQQTSVPFLFPTPYSFKTYRIASTYMQLDTYKNLAVSLERFVNGTH